MLQNYSHDFSQSHSNSWRRSSGIAELLRGLLRQNAESQKENSAFGDSQSSGYRSPKIARLEAALFVADGPLSVGRLTHFAMLADNKECKKLISELNEQYDATSSTFRVEQIASGFQLMTRPQFSFWLNKLHQRKAELKLSASAMETLSVVAYRQPVTRADIEAVRGVQASEMLKQLMERGLVRISGTDDSLGRPFLYSTTRSFLELFGLHGLAELPMSDLLKPIVEEEPIELELVSDEDFEDDEEYEDEDEQEDEDLELEDEDEEYEGEEEDEYEEGEYEEGEYEEVDEEVDEEGAELEDEEDLEEEETLEEESEELEEDEEWDEEENEEEEDEDLEDAA